MDDKKIIAAHDNELSGSWQHGLDAYNATLGGKDSPRLRLMQAIVSAQTRASAGSIPVPAIDLAGRTTTTSRAMLAMILGTGDFLTAQGGTWVRDALSNNSDLAEKLGMQDYRIADIADGQLGAVFTDLLLDIPIEDQRKAVDFVWAYKVEMQPPSVTPISSP